MQEFNEENFRILHNNVPPTKGCVLISEPFLQDSYFQRAVVYLTDHSDLGSMGFVLNKNLDVTLNELIDGLDKRFTIPVFLGGPVKVDTLFYLHTLPFITESYKVSESLYLNGDFEMIKEYINNGGITEGKIKFFFGYSGWESGQLDDEIKDNAWMVGHTSDLELLNTNSQRIWERALARLGEKYKMWTKLPKDPSLN